MAGIRLSTPRLKKMPELLPQTSDLSLLNDYLYQLGRNAKAAYNDASRATPAQRVNVLHDLAKKLLADKKAILKENRKDLRLAQTKRLAPQLVDRLELDHNRFTAMVEGVQQVAALPDPVGNIRALESRPSGIRVGKMRVPLGVIVMIYESRPNVTIDAATLNMRVGNAVILRGGSESFNTNMALNNSIKAALQSAGLPQTLVQLVEHTNREAVSTLVQMDDCVDLVIPRGGRELIQRVMQASRVNLLKHLDGNCHIYVDTKANLNMAKELVLNAKTRRYGVCNALESLLVASPVAKEFFATGVAEELMQAGVKIHACAKSLPLLSGENLLPAREKDWSTEYLGPDLSLKLVDGLETAITHINQYGSHHTDAIVTDSLEHSKAFLRRVDSSSVMVNASTAFADGFEYGLGAEIGVSTDKFHARGPVGLEGLTSEKYIVLGHGETRP